MSEDNNKNWLAGTTIVAGTAVGAGMFSLPVVSALQWSSWSVLLLLFTWFFMFSSSLLILEANLNFKPGASFSTIVGNLLGPRWNLLNSISLCFVLYILTYAYISGGGSVTNETLQALLGIELPSLLATLIFTGALMLVVWVSTAWVGRLTSVLLAGMLGSFILSVSGLATLVNPIQISRLEPAMGWYIFATLPYYLTSFGYHGCVPSLVKYYGSEPRLISRCMLFGSLFSLAIYLIWLLAIHGILDRNQLLAIRAEGAISGIC